jgi:hypothetical protein
MLKRNKLTEITFRDNNAYENFTEVLGKQG